MVAQPPRFSELHERIHFMQRFDYSLLLCALTRMCRTRTRFVSSLCISLPVIFKGWLATAMTLTYSHQSPYSDVYETFTYCHRIITIHNPYTLLCHFTSRSTLSCQPSLPIGATVRGINYHTLLCSRFLTLYSFQGAVVSFGCAPISLRWSNWRLHVVDGFLWDSLTLRPSHKAISWGRCVPLDGFILTDINNVARSLANTEKEPFFGVIFGGRGFNVFPRVCSPWTYGGSTSTLTKNPILHTCNNVSHPHPYLSSHLSFPYIPSPITPSIRQPIHTISTHHFHQTISATKHYVHAAYPHCHANCN